MKTDRLLEMEKYVFSRESVSMEELCSHFGVSINTVRRDVSELTRKGVVDKVYGGVCARKTPEQALTPFDARSIVDDAAKRRIGACAASLVHDGDIIFLDSGTTTVHVVEHLRDRRDLTVVTNSLAAIVRLMPFDNINVIALPGQLRRKTSSFTGLEAARALRGYNIRLALMASTGATTSGVTNSSPLEYEVKRCAIELCQSAALLMSSAKFGTTGLMTYAGFSDFDVIVTDKRPPDEYARRIEESGAELMLAP